MYVGKSSKAELIENFNVFNQQTPTSTSAFTQTNKNIHKSIKASASGQSQPIFTPT
jgi:hypothetical protein